MLKLGDSWTNYPLIFHELHSDSSELLFEDDNVTVNTIPLDHRVYTNGFLFREKPYPRSLDIEAAKKYGIDRSQFNKIKAGENGVTAEGTVVSNQKLTFDPPKTKSYAFCSDTAYDESILPLIGEVDVLYHESTFLDSESELCSKTKHSTAKQAALMAKGANVGLLILGHYSTRYKSLTLFKEEALLEFPDVELAEDGKIFDL